MKWFREISWCPIATVLCEMVQRDILVSYWYCFVRNGSERYLGVLLLLFCVKWFREISWCPIATVLCEMVQRDILVSYCYCFVQNGSERYLGVLLLLFCVKSGE